jgi:hypothetical protein
MGFFPAGPGCVVKIGILGASRLQGSFTYRVMFIKRSSTWKLLEFVFLPKW